MKNIILMDRDELFIDDILKRGYTIIVLILNDDIAKNKAIEKYKNSSQIHSIYSIQDITHIDGVEFLDYEYINTFRALQREQEFAAHRFLNNGMLSINAYYNALFFWKNIFDKNHIDFILYTELLRGYSEDISVGIAKAMGIPVFFLPPTCGVDGRSILNYTNSKFINTIRESSVEAKKSIFYKFSPDDCFDEINSKSIKKFIHNILLKVGGQLLVDFVMCIKNRTWTLRQHAGNYPFLFWDKFNSFLYVKKMKKYYNHISINPDLETKFIFYAMHFEPEGGTCVTVTLQNQLTIIQMLNKAMPKGWKLYVKEHPHQFNLNNVVQSFYYYNIKWWKNIEFYESVSKLNNVNMINFDIPSKTLIQKSVAIATINGTITLESILFNKPVILFGADSFPFKTKNMISICSYNDLKITMNKLINNINEFSLNEDGEKVLDSLNKKFFSFDTPNCVDIVLDTIEDYLANDHEKL